MPEWVSFTPATTVKISEVVSLPNLNIYSSLFSSHSTLVAFGLFFMYMGMSLFSDTQSLSLFIIQLVVSDCSVKDKRKTN